MYEYNKAAIAFWVLMAAIPLFIILAVGD